MNIHADDIGLSIVVRGSSLVGHTYTLWMYATLLLYICGFYTVRARAAAIDHRIGLLSWIMEGDYWKIKYENASPAKTSIMFHQPITR